jgi:asparagine synthase (glutamine-hydrolysing)
MVSADGSLSMVFNGEIYNYIELRAELESLGHRFHSSGDSEVLLTAYRQWGESCVNRLVGMWAFCIIDHARSRLFLSRDRFGIKPLYYLQHARGILFASELKVLRRSGLWGGAISVPRMASILLHERTDAIAESDDTILEGIRQLPAACTMRLEYSGAHRIERYWAPPDAESGDARHVVPEFLEHFDTSLRLHMRADVPVGVMLSGGMDSVSIACAMSRLSREAQSDQPLHAFCYMSPDFDESVQLNDTLAQTGITAHQLTGVDHDTFWQRLDEAMWHQDEPVHSSSVLMGYELYRMAADHGIRVVLSGQGADETLGGYHFYFGPMLVSLAMAGRLPSLLREARNVARSSGQDLTTTLWSCARSIQSSFISKSARLRSVRAARALAHASGRPYLSPEFASLAPAEVRMLGGGGLATALTTAVEAAPLPQYLRVEDRNSMAHSVESRVPFLDHRLVEFGMRLPVEWKLADGWNKRSLRESMKDLIPESVRLRPQKFGFPTSARQWFAGPLAPRLRDLLTSGPVVDSGWFNVPRVRQQLEAHVRGETDATNLLFNVAQFDSWLRWHQSGWKRG